MMLAIIITPTNMVYRLLMRGLLSWPTGPLRQNLKIHLHPNYRVTETWNILCQTVKGAPE